MRNKQYITQIATRNAALVTLAALVTGCQSQKSSSSQKELFPVYGITLGQTDEDSLKNMGKADDGHYVVHGQNFWVDDGIFDHMYMTEGQLPLKWRNLGLDWYLSYDQWLNLLNDLGFTVTIKEAPSLKMYRGRESFYAKVEAVKISKIPTKLVLDFKYSEETTTSAEGTLYSIKIRIP
jgi:hypothetical protein